MDAFRAIERRPTPHHVAGSGSALFAIEPKRTVDVMATTRWNRLDPRVRQALVLGGAFEAGLKVASLIDLAQRPADAVRGSRRLWATALIVVNSGGVVPIVYLLRGRRKT